MSKLKHFSGITKFRLLALGSIIIMFDMYVPILTYLKAQYLDLLDIKPQTWIGIFAFLMILARYYSSKLVNFLRISTLFKLLLFSHFLGVVVSLLYFKNVTLMIYLESALGIIELPILDAYGLALGNYMIYFENDKYEFFQEYRMKIIVYSGLIGSGLSILITYFFSIGISVAIFAIFYILIWLWFFSKIKLFKENDNAYRYRYVKKNYKFMKKLKNKSFFRKYIM